MTDRDWWRGCVIYQVYPRSFMDGDGDGVGDLAGVTSRLEHIASLGVDAIWLSPFFTSPMRDMGYDVSDYRDVDPSFGTLADFDALVRRAHELGLKVIIDQVYSHSSDQHPAFLESRQSRTNPKADWYVWADPKTDGTAPNNWLSRFGGISWEWEPRRGQYYLHNFLKEQPDLNLHNPEVQRFILDVMRFWLDRGVDGFRLDVVNFYFHDILLRDDPPAPDQPRPLPRPVDAQRGVYSRNRPENLDFLRRMRALMDEYENRAFVGEVGGKQDALRIMSQYTTDNRLHMAYSFALLGAEFSAGFLRRQVETFFKYAPDGWPCWSFSNHDCIRHVSRWSRHGVGGAPFARQAAALLSSLEGSICVYQGEEFGLPETSLEYSELVDPKGIAYWPADKGRDGCRTPLPWEAGRPNGGFSTAPRTWLPVKSECLAFAADTQTGEESVLAFYRQMLEIRRRSKSLRTGRTTFIDTPEPILAFRRGDDLVCVFNLSPDPGSTKIDLKLKPLIQEGATLKGRSIELAPSGFLIGEIR